MRQALMRGLGAAVAAASLPLAMAQTEDPVAADFDKFRAIMEEANPAELFDAKGEQLWKTPGGPKKASLEKCDLGLGP
ncbi:MAG: sulfur oxidation c-type cytochrome SoxA, partial [Betaproteobacteria bacterium]|nr:sulfur oxidation c-type cytochrome SoxA [Betaproteobacteria bacterium]